MGWVNFIYFCSGGVKDGIAKHPTQTKSMMVSSIIRSTLLVIATTLHSTSIANAQYSTIDGHDCFRDLDGMYQTMFDLAKTYPNLVRVMDIGDSYTKATGSKNDFGVSGYDIYAMNITVADSATPSSEKGRSLITSGIHSREYAPPELSMRFAESLIDGYNNADADITWILQHNEVHFIIHVNPDGRYVAENDRNIYWRKNLNDEGGCSSNEEYGVDINRNFDFMWGDRDGASNDPCDSDYHGDYPESEPETQAVSNYARALFPEGQRRSDPLNDEAGEDITGMYTDIHAAGGYIYFPWGHANKRSPDDEALQALGKKLKYYNNYKFWAPGSPDFLYPASGDASDYMYGALSVASYGLELGEGFYEDCGLFERDVLPKNLPALLYSVSISKRPFHQVKGPDITDLSIASPSLFSDVIAVSVEASDSKKSGGEVTGNQGVNKVHLYLDVHPDDYNTASDVAWELEPTVVNSDTYIFEQELSLKTSIVSPSQRIAAGRHLLYAQAEDGNGYKGPVKATFLEVESRETLAPSMSPVASTSKPTPTFNPTAKPTLPPIPPFNSFTSSPSKNPTRLPTYQPSNNPTNEPTPLPTKFPTPLPTTLEPSTEPTFPPSSFPTTRPSTTSPSRSPFDKPSASPLNTPTTTSPSSQPVTASPTSTSELQIFEATDEVAQATDEATDEVILDNASNVALSSLAVVVSALLSSYFV